MAAESRKLSSSVADLEAPLVEHSYQSPMWFVQRPSEGSVFCRAIGAHQPTHDENWFDRNRFLYRRSLWSSLSQLYDELSMQPFNLESDAVLQTRSLELEAYKIQPSNYGARS